MIKKLIATALSFAMVLSITLTTSASPEMETVYSVDFAETGSYDVASDGWVFTQEPEFFERGLRVKSGTNKWRAHMTYLNPLSAVFKIRLDDFYYHYNGGEIIFNSDFTDTTTDIKNGYQIRLDGQYSTNLKISLVEFKNGVSITLAEKNWTEACSSMRYDIDISYDRGLFEIFLVNTLDTSKTCSLEYDFTQGGTVTDYHKSGTFRLKGGDDGVLEIKSIEVQSAKSDLEATKLSAPFNAPAMYNLSEPVVAKIAVNKDLSELSAISCYVDGEEQLSLAYKDGELKSGVTYSDGEFSFTPEKVSEGLHEITVEFTDSLEVKKSYSGKFYVGSYKILLGGFKNAAGEEISSLAEAAGGIAEAELLYGGTEKITAVACLYNADGALEKITCATGENGEVNVKCDIPSDAEGYVLSVYTSSGFASPAPLSFGFDLK